VLATARASLSDIESALGVAESKRDEVFSEIDQLIAAELSKRNALVSELPDDVTALYTRIRDGGKVAAGELRGGRCGACRMEIDRTALGQIKAAPIEEIVRCPECGAILVRA